MSPSAALGRRGVAPLRCAPLRVRDPPALLPLPGPISIPLPFFPFSRSIGVYTWTRHTPLCLLGFFMLQQYSSRYMDAFSLLCKYVLDIVHQLANNLLDAARVYRAKTLPMTLVLSPSNWNKIPCQKLWCYQLRLPILSDGSLGTIRLYALLDFFVHSVK